MSSTILVPLDGSRLSERALGPATELARQRGARLHLVRVVPPVLPATMDPVPVLQSSTEQDLESATSYLAEHRDAIQDLVSEVTLACPVGDPAHSIVEECEDVDLVVMTSHGWSGFDRLLLGSVTEQVVRKAHKPVLIVRSQPVRLEDVSHILVPLDGSELSERAIPVARQLAQETGASLALCQILDTAYVDQRLSAIMHGREKELEPIKAYLKEKARMLGSEIATTTIWGVGSPARTLLQLCGSHDIDLVVMATHGRGGLDRIMCGSVAENVVRASVSPVLLVPK